MSDTPDDEITRRSRGATEGFAAGPEPRDRPKRIASHPDDPSASLADRLLLALGIWPDHATQVGRTAVVDAAVQIRTDAHKYPMVVADLSAEREIREYLETIVRDLAAQPPPVMDDGTCGYCMANLLRATPNMPRHRESCLWRRAVERTRGQA